MLKKRVKSKIQFRINFKKIFLTFLAAIITSLLLSTVIISLPLTEKIYSNVRYDLTFEQAFWKKEYTLDIDIKPEDYNQKGKKINETKSIILRRLRDYGVQKVSFKNLKTDDKKKAKLRIIVESDRDKSTVDRLISERYYIRFVTRKAGVNFEDTNNQFAAYDPSNYNSTKYTRHDFRTVYITKLKASTGEYSYFAIYKPWEYKSGEFYKFMDKYAGQYAGLEIDGFVTPIIVPVTAGQSGQAGVTSRQPFALGVGTDKGISQSINLLLNSGVIPLNYTLAQSKDVSINNLEIDHIKTIVILFGITIAITAVIIFAHIRLDLRNVLAYLLSITTMVAVAKLFSFPVQLITLLYAMIFITTLLPLFISSIRTSLLILIMTCFVYIFRIGYIRDIAFYMLAFMTLFVFYERVMVVYSDLIRRITK